MSRLAIELIALSRRRKDAPAGMPTLTELLTAIRKNDPEQPRKIAGMIVRSEKLYKARRREEEEADLLLQEGLEEVGLV